MIRPLFPKRPSRKEYFTDAEYFEAEIEWWKQREARSAWIIRLALAVAVLLGVLIGTTCSGCYHHTQLRPMSESTKEEINTRLREIEDASRGVVFQPLTKEKK